MELQVWEDGARELLPSVEEVLKNVLLKKIQVEMAASSVTDPSMTIEALKTGTVVIQGEEELTGSELFIAYDENWLPQLSNAMLGVEETELNEITQDLIKEFSSQLIGTLQTGLQQQSVSTQPSELSILKSGQISKTVTSDSYFMVQLDVSGKFEIDGDELPQLALIIAVSVPDEEAVKNVLPQTEDQAGEQEPEAETEQQPEGVQPDEPVAESEPEVESTPAEEQPAEQMDTGAEAQAQEQAAQQQSQQQETARKKRKTSPVEGKPVEFDEISSSPQARELETRNLDILKDVELDISVELGRKEVPLGEILHMVRGSVIELDKLAGEPVEIYANGHRIAEGEVVVIDENFGVRVTNLVSTKERIESLR